MIKFDRIYYEKEIENYELGRYLLEKYKDLEKISIKSHNNIEELRKYENKDFPKLKRYLIIGVRKTHKYVENYKVSDYLVPFTSSGCTAMCMYCYLVCNYNKCSYLRIYVNKEEIYGKIVKKVNSYSKDITLEIGSNSDLILENQITGNLNWIIEKFSKLGKGYLTLPTKFSMVDDILNLNHNKRIIIRMSINPQYIISKVEFGTSNLKDRIEAINKLVKAGYIVGILVAPVIIIDEYKKLYKDMLIYLKNNLIKEAKDKVFFEVIFMTYSFIHDKINSEVFPNSIKIYDKEKMRGRGRGKYMYKGDYLQDGKNYIEHIIKYYFPNNKIIYIV